MLQSESYKVQVKNFSTCNADLMTQDVLNSYRNTRSKRVHTCVFDCHYWCKHWCCIFLQSFLRFCIFFPKEFGHYLNSTERRRTMHNFYRKVLDDLEHLVNNRNRFSGLPSWRCLILNISSPFAFSVLFSCLGKILNLMMTQALKMKGRIFLFFFSWHARRWNVRKRARSSRPLALNVDLCKRNCVVISIVSALSRSEQSSTYVRAQRLVDKCS